MQEVKDPVKQAHHVEVNHWLRMMGRLQDPVVARLVLGFLNDNPDLRDTHPGAFLLASETVKRDQIRYAKAYAWGKLAKSVSRATGRGTVVAFTGLCMLATAGLSGVRKLKHTMSRPAAPDARQEAPAPTRCTPTHRRCLIRQRRNELHAQRGATRSFG